MKREQTYSLMRWGYGHLTHLKLFNEEILPKEGSFILATNHMSRIDFPALIGLQRCEDVVPIAGDSYRTFPILGKIIDSVNPIWIDRTQADFSALRAALSVLKEGKILVLAPEGTRSRNAQLLHAKSGIVLIAAKSRIPVYTMSVTGTEYFMNDFKHFRKPKINIYFGPACDIPEIDRENREASLEKATDEIMCRIAALLPESYRGYYRDYPRVAELIAQYKQEGALAMPEA